MLSESPDEKVFIEGWETKPDDAAGI